MNNDLSHFSGRQILPPGIPAYAGQPTASFVNLSDEQVDPVKTQEFIKPESQEIKMERKRNKRSLSDLFDSYPEQNPDQNKESVRKNLAKTALPNITESELLQLLVQIKKLKEDELRNSLHPSKKYFVDTLDTESRKTLTTNQVQILRLMEDLNPETSRGVISQLWQCIRSLSMIRCAGIFIWPMITNNLPSFSPFSSRSEDSSEFQEIFGLPPNDFEKELILKKQEFEDVFLSWYKTLMERQFESNIGFLRIKGHGNGELAISIAGFREGRAKIIKDNKNLPSILTVLSEIMEDVLERKPNANKNKESKKGKSIKFEENNYQILTDSAEDPKIERSMKDNRVLDALLEKLRNNDTDASYNEYGHYFNIDDAYNAFELLFGTKFTDEIGSRLKSFSENQFRSFINKHVEQEETANEELKIVPLEVQEKILEEKLKTVPRIIPQSSYNWNDEIGKVIKVKEELSKDRENSRDQEKSKNDNKDGGFIRKKKHRNELSIQLPRLDDVISRKITSSILNFGRGLKTKMMQMVPGIGIVISFLIQMTVAHARTAASVAGLMSNLALGMSMFSMVRDALFGQPNQPKVKYVYDTDIPDPGVSWPKEPSYWK